MKRIKKALLIWIVPLFVVSVILLAPRNKESLFPQRIVNMDAGKLQSLGYVGNEAPASSEPRKIIHSGEITLVVKRYEPFFRALQSQLGRSGGYVAQIEATRNGEQVDTATIRFRIPPHQLDVMVSWLAEQGVVASERITAEDISEQYYDLEARLNNARKFEGRLIQMLQTQTGQLNDVVLVEEKLNQIREQIEQMQGKMRLYDQLVSLATLTLNVRVEQQTISPHTPTFGEEAIRAWRDSTHALKEFGQGTALLAITVAPWIVPLLLLAVALRILLLQRIRRLFRVARNARILATESTEVTEF